MRGVKSLIKTSHGAACTDQAALHMLYLEQEDGISLGCCPHKLINAVTFLEQP
jgi:hypothetical protein